MVEKGGWGGEEGNEREGKKGEGQIPVSLTFNMVTMPTGSTARRLH